MAGINVGTLVAKTLKVGTTQVQKMYLGASQIWANWVATSGNLVVMTSTSAPSPFTCSQENGSYLAFTLDTTWQTSMTTSSPWGILYLNSYNNSKGIIPLTVGAKCGASDVRNCHVDVRIKATQAWQRVAEINPGVGHNEWTYKEVAISTEYVIDAIKFYYDNTGQTARLGVCRVVSWKI